MPGLHPSSQSIDILGLQPQMSSQNSQSTDESEDSIMFQGEYETAQREFNSSDSEQDLPEETPSNPRAIQNVASGIDGGTEAQLVVDKSLPQSLDKRNLLLNNSLADDLGLFNPEEATLLSHKNVIDSSGTDALELNLSELDSADLELLDKTSREVLDSEQLGDQSSLLEDQLLVSKVSDTVFGSIQFDEASDYQMSPNVIDSGLLHEDPAADKDITDLEESLLESTDALLQQDSLDAGSEQSSNIQTTEALDRTEQDKLRLSGQELSPQELSPQELSPQELSPQELSPQELSPQELSPQDISEQQQGDQFAAALYGQTPVQQGQRKHSLDLIQSKSATDKGRSVDMSPVDAKAIVSTVEGETDSDLDVLSNTDTDTKIETKTARQQQLLSSQQASDVLLEKATQGLDTFDLKSAASDLADLDSEGVSQSSMLQNKVQGSHQLPVELSIAKPVQETGWSDKFIEKVRWMVSAQHQKAEIRLDPPDLGPLKLDVSIKNDHAQVTMVTHSSQVREILDQHLPRLREMLESQGFQSVDAQTQDQQKDSSRHAGHQDIRHATSADGQMESDEIMKETELVVEKAGKGRVDCYI